MKLSSFIIGLFTLLTFAAALADQNGNPQTTPTVTPKTTVWVTITTNGAVATVQTIYSQSFMSTFTAAASQVQQGNVGLGSLSGTVGGERSYSEVTINGADSLAPTYVYSGVVGFLFMLIA